MSLLYSVPGIVRSCRLGLLDSAIEAFTEAINIECNFLSAYISRGNAYMDYLTFEGNRKSRYVSAYYVARLVVLALTIIMYPYIGWITYMCWNWIPATCQQE